MKVYRRLVLKCADRRDQELANTQQMPEESGSD